jgi:D-3-phosphoglycerate dehydrogenase
MTPTVVVVENEKFDAGIARDVLGGRAEMVITDADTVEGVVAAAREADALIPWYVSLDAAALEELASLSVIGIPGTGVGGVDPAAAAASGITLLKPPTNPPPQVSPHPLAMLLSCARSLPAFDDAVREGVWSREPGVPIRRLRGRTLGLLAFGDIARRTAEKARGFGLDVIAYDPYVDADAMVSRGVTPVDFGSLLARSELFSVHAPDSPETVGLLDDDAFESMREGVLLVNTGRGSIVEEAALLDALDDGTVAAAGLDVFETEPPRGSPLLEREDVLLSPHVGWYSEDSREDVIRSVAEDVGRVFDGDEPEGSVDPGAAWT